VSVGGQIPNNLAVPLSKQGVNVLGTQPDSIDNAEDRERFSATLDRLGIDQPEWMALSSVDDAKKFAGMIPIASARCGNVSGLRDFGYQCCFVA